MPAPAYRVLALVLTCAFVLPIVGHAQVSVADARFKALDVNEDGGHSTFEYDSDEAMRMMDGDESNLVSAAELQSFFGPENDNEKRGQSKFSENCTLTPNSLRQ